MEERLGVQVVEAPAEEAHEWLQYSLMQGFDVSAAVSSSGVLGRGRFLAIVSEDFQRTVFDYPHGGVIGQRLSRMQLAQILEDLASGEAKSVLVEDSASRRGDRSVSRRGEPSAFIADRVLHWGDLAAGSKNAVEVIAWGTTGYPTNAFVVTRSSADLGLADLQDAPENLAEEVASSLMAIVVAAFDAESFLIWVDR